MTWLQNANQYVRIAAGEFVLHIHMFLLKTRPESCLAIANQYLRGTVDPVTDPFTKL